MKIFFLLSITLIFVISCTTSNGINQLPTERGPASVLKKTENNSSSQNTDSPSKLYLKLLFSKTGNFKEMSTGDCKAYSNQNEFYCSTKDCTAILKNQSTLCESNDCKALIENNANLCSSATCKALVNDNQMLCDEKDKNCKVIFNPNLCETAECDGFLKGFQGRCTTPACNALVNENMNECGH